jgi:predicted transcriptional regulator
MKAMNYTSSLPEELIEMLDTYARKFKMPKNRIMEQALRAYFEKLKKAEYAHSFRRAASDEEQVLMDEEGLEDYLKIISEE